MSSGKNPPEQRLPFRGQEFEGTKEENYGTSGQHWVGFTDENGVNYVWYVYSKESVWRGNYNTSRGSAAAILGADGYDMYVWHTNANPSNVNGPLHGEGSKIVDASTGEVRFGEHALKLTYDYRNFSPTGGTKNCNTYYRVTNPLTAQGSPTGFGIRHCFDCLRKHIIHLLRRKECAGIQHNSKLFARVYKPVVNLNGSSGLKKIHLPIFPLRVPCQQLQMRNASVSSRYSRLYVLCNCHLLPRSGPTVIRGAAGAM